MWIKKNWTKTSSNRNRGPEHNNSSFMQQQKNREEAEEETSRISLKLVRQPHATNLFKSIFALH